MYTGKVNKNIKFKKKYYKLNDEIRFEKTDYNVLKSHVSDITEQTEDIPVIPSKEELEEMNIEEVKKYADIVKISYPQNIGKETLIKKIYPESEGD